MSRPSLREKILDAGIALLHKRGYFACGVREITEAAGVPLGSFTNHFRSKEMFAALVLDRYMDGLLEIVARTLRDRSREPLARIASYFDAVEGIAGPLEWRFGCMVANLGLELSMHSGMARARLMTALEQLTNPFAEAIREAQERGQARTDIGAEDLAVIVLSGWHGALLRAKVEQRGDAPLMFARTLPLLLQAVTDEPEKLQPHGDDRRGAANPLEDVDSRGGRLRRDTVSLWISGASADCYGVVPLAGRCAGRA